MPLRIAAVPAGHPYVDAVTPPGVQVLPDPTPPGAPPGQWWPPQVLDPVWLRASAAGIDLVHVHFGVESVPHDTLMAAVATIRQRGIPLVYTVHDLANPQLVDQGAHEAALEVLVPAADRLLTLSVGAAAEIARRWGREATVVPHPAVLPAGAVAPIGTPSPSITLGAHLRDLRPNIDAVAAVRTLARSVAALRRDGIAVDAVVRMNDRVRDVGAAAAITHLVESVPGMRLELGARLDDAALAEWVADLDACLLPYRHGTHSGFAELCFDLGVPVIGTPIGAVATQHPSDFFAFEVGDAESLTAAVRGATSAPASRPGSAARAALVAARSALRAEERMRVHEIHTAVYRDLLAVRAAA